MTDRQERKDPQRKFLTGVLIEPQEISLDISVCGQVAGDIPTDRDDGRY
jgi:hypothetical protein